MTKTEMRAIERAGKIVAVAILMQSKSEPKSRIEAIDVVNAIQAYFNKNDEQG